MDKDVEEQLLKRRQQLKKNPNLLKRKWLKPFSARIRQMLDLDIPLPQIRSWLDDKKLVKITLQTLRNFVIKEFGEDFYKEYCLRNGWQKTKQNIPLKKSAEPRILKTAVQEVEEIPVQTRPLVVHHVSAEKLEQILNTHIDPKNIPSRPLPAD